MHSLPELWISRHLSWLSLSCLSTCPNNFLPPSAASHLPAQMMLHLLSLSFPLHSFALQQPLLERIHTCVFFLSFPSELVNFHLGCGTEETSTCGHLKSSSETENLCWASTHFPIANSHHCTIFWGKAWNCYDAVNWYHVIIRSTLPH